jgi:hypothetical protein
MVACRRCGWANIALDGKAAESHDLFQRREPSVNGLIRRKRMCNYGGALKNGPADALLEATVKRGPATVF